MGLDRYYQMQYHFFLVSFHMSLVLATATVPSLASATVPSLASTSSAATSSAATSSAATVVPAVPAVPVVFL
jgi:hypothetical protein